MIDLKTQSQTILEQAKKAGADQAEVFLQTAKQTACGISDQKVEHSTRSIIQGFGLTFCKAKRSIFVNSSDFSKATIDEIIDKAAQIVRFADEDPYLLLPKAPESYARMDLLDHGLGSIPIEKKLQYLLSIEREAMKLDPRVQKAAWVGWNETIEQRAIANSHGLFCHYPKSTIELEASLLAVAGEDRREGEHSVNTFFFNRLPSAESFAKRAVEATVYQLNAAPVPTVEVPVVFHPVASWSLFYYGIFKGVSGQNIARQSSYLTGKLGQKIASPLITIIDDGLMKNGIGSAPCDDEGVPSQRTVIVEKGMLKNYLYDTYWAGRAGTTSTSHAIRRSYHERCSLSPRNLYLVAGETNPEAIIAGVQNGFYVRKTIGFGVDSVTGSYSIGASGLWIRDGKISEPVSGVTIASSLSDLFGNIDMVGNDLEFNYNVSVPTFRVSKMTVGGH